MKNIYSIILIFVLLSSCIDYGEKREDLPLDSIQECTSPLFESLIDELETALSSDASNVSLDQSEISSLMETTKTQMDQNSLSCSENLTELIPGLIKSSETALNGVSATDDEKTVIIGLISGSLVQSFIIRNEGFFNGSVSASSSETNQSGRTGSLMGGNIHLLNQMDSLADVLDLLAEIPEIAIQHTNNSGVDDSLLPDASGRIMASIASKLTTENISLSVAESALSAAHKGVVKAVIELDHKRQIDLSNSIYKATKETVEQLQNIDLGGNTKDTFDQIAASIINGCIDGISESDVDNSLEDYYQVVLDSSSRGAVKGLTNFSNGVLSDVEKNISIKRILTVARGDNRTDPGGIDTIISTDSVQLSSPVNLSDTTSGTCKFGEECPENSSQVLTGNFHYKNDSTADIYSLATAYGRLMESYNASETEGMGNVVVQELIGRDTNIWYCLYGCLEEKMDLGSRFSRIAKGSQIGQLGLHDRFNPSSPDNTGCSADNLSPDLNGRHLYFECKRADLDYSSYLWPHQFLDETEAEVKKQAMGHPSISTSTFLQQYYIDPMSRFESNSFEVLIPFITSYDSTPDRNNYDVFGISGHDMTWAFSVKPIDNKTFAHIGVGGRIQDDDSIIRDLGYQKSVSIQQYETLTIHGKSAKPAGDYKFNVAMQPELDGWYGGYPIFFTVVQNHLSTIVDNHSLAGYVQSPVLSKTVPGYYLTGEILLVDGDYDDFWAKWKPNAIGEYEVYVYVPVESGFSNTIYKIYENDYEFTCSIPINQGDPDLHGHWVQLRKSQKKCQKSDKSCICYDGELKEAENASIIEFTDRGYIGISTYHIDTEEQVGLDAVLFEKKPATSTLNPEETVVDTDSSGFTYNCLNNSELHSNETLGWNGLKYGYALGEHENCIASWEFDSLNEGYYKVEAYVGNDDFNDNNGNRPATTKARYKIKRRYHVDRYYSLNQQEPGCGEHNCWVTIGTVHHRGGDLFVELDDTGEPLCCGNETTVFHDDTIAKSCEVNLAGNQADSFSCKRKILVDAIRITKL